MPLTKLREVLLILLRVLVKCLGLIRFFLAVYCFDLHYKPSFLPQNEFYLSIVDYPFFLCFFYFEAIFSSAQHSLCLCSAIFLGRPWEHMLSRDQIALEAKYPNCFTFTQTDIYDFFDESLAPIYLVFVVVLVLEISVFC